MNCIRVELITKMSVGLRDDTRKWISDQPGVTSNGVYLVPFSPHQSQLFGCNISHKDPDFQLLTRVACKEGSYFTDQTYIAFLQIYSQLPKTAFYFVLYHDIGLIQEKSSADLYKSFKQHVKSPQIVQQLLDRVKP